jgi:glutaredoxin 3
MSTSWGGFLVMRVANMKVEIYTKPHCPYCERAKELLQIKGIAFAEYVVNDDPAGQAEMRRRGAGETFPSIFIAGRLIGGCRELFEFDESGALDRLLKSSPENIVTRP